MLTPILTKPPNTKECHIIKLLAQGFKQEQIATMIFLSHETVKSYVRDLKKRYDCKNSCELVSYAMKKNWIDWDELD